MKPGATTRPFTSRTVSPATGLKAPMSLTLPSRMRTFPRNRVLRVPSIIVPFTSTTFSANTGVARTTHNKRHRTGRIEYTLANYGYSGIRAQGRRSLLDRRTTWRDAPRRQDYLQGSDAFLHRANQAGRSKAECLHNRHRRVGRPAGGTRRQRTQGRLIPRTAARNPIRREGSSGN